MTDYLELAAGGEADALWQASRERGIPVPADRDLAAAGREENAPAGEWPLLEELTRAQRQSESAVSLARHRGAGEQTANLPDKRLRRTFGEAAFGTEAGGRILPRGTAEGEDHLWAKRVDLAFQRDTRRYDGQFSLY